MFPRDAPYMDTLRQELPTFPAAAKDDQVDSINQFLAWAINASGRSLLRDRAWPDRPVRR